MTKKNLLILFGLLTITDAYLISHPNLIGRIGVLFYNYDMLQTFPRALVTVLLSLGVCLGITYLAEIFSEKPWVKILPWLGLLASIGILIQVIIKFSAGSYRLTGKPFIFGMHLLPVLMILVFLNYFWNKYQTN